MGLWQVRRRLVDHLGQTHLAFTGEARIGADSFTETGELHSNRGVMESKRLYLLAMDDTGADVRFAGGSDFIRLDLGPASVMPASPATNGFQPRHEPATRCGL
jgi:hypothetical protein